jgi:hypothetical protein
VVTPRSSSTQTASARRRGKQWTRTKLIEAIKAWTQSVGQPPTVYDWYGRVMRERRGLQGRYEATGRQWPSTSTVIKTFGAWSAALEAAEVKRTFPRRTHCKRGHKLTPANVYVQPGTGSRVCRRCLRERGRLVEQRKAREEVLKRVATNPQFNPAWPLYLRRAWLEAHGEGETPNSKKGGTSNA